MQNQKSAQNCQRGLLKAIQGGMQLAFRSKISKDSLRSAGKYEQDLKGDEQGEVRKLQTFLFSCSVIQRMRPKQNLQGSEGGLYLFLLQTSRTLRDTCWFSLGHCLPLPLLSDIPATFPTLLKLFLAEKCPLSAPGRYHLSAI